jgi:hypothetical protein
VLLLIQIKQENKKISVWKNRFFYLCFIFIGILDIGMTIACDENGKFQIQHWPPLPVDDSVAILQILEVRINFKLYVLWETIF